MPVMCYICGREFGTASISIHIPNCEKKWDNEQMKLPKKQRRPPPSKPMDFERVINGELKGKDLQSAMDEYNQQAFDDFNKKALVECKNCGRTFLPRALEVHSRSCKPGQESEEATEPVLKEKSKAKSAKKTRVKRQPRSPTKVGIPQPQPPTGMKKSSTTSMKPASNARSPTRTSNLLEANNNKTMIRPGTYKKSGTTPCDEADEDPTREDIIAMVERDVSFSSVENRKLLMGFIKKICQAGPDQRLT